MSRDRLRTAVLTYVEIVRIDAICQWCVSSALLMTALAGMSVTRVLRADGGATPRADSART